LEDICRSKRGEARATVESMPHTGLLATASAPEAAEAAEVDEEEGAGAVPEWLEHSDGRFSPPLLPSDAVAGDIVDEDDDRETLLALRTQVRPCSCVVVLSAPSPLSFDIAMPSSPSQLESMKLTHRDHYPAERSAWSAGAA
jgi:hypothetical protein